MQKRSGTVQQNKAWQVQWSGLSLITAEQVARGIEDRQHSALLPWGKGQPLLPEITFLFHPAPRVYGQMTLEQERETFKDVCRRQAPDA